VRSRRFLYLLLIFVALDFAFPYEPTARGWQEYEDEEESVHPAARRIERPTPSAGRPVSRSASALSRPRPVPGAGREPSRQPEVPVTRLARADTSSPPASPEAH
jgi:hypothetical protein